ncbi:acyl-CoA dehydrogenase family protein [uncultured Albimonas sp.]|uniref:acyl-CoA dehydrogenase family protein n=1 Tax=uncultured Albimonas sp. TaxID=1331701 RepID=UPI0030EF8A68|tara:strand:- start:20599 stop:21810 length:1212 start_codon:yes stop_codon:yes gene_type:complete
MDFAPSPDDDAFRAEIRATIDRLLPAEMKARRLADFDTAEADARAWIRILDDAGLAVPAWPVEHGGRPWSPLRKFIFAQELQHARAPAVDRIATEMVAPVLWTFGSQAQKAELLPRIRRGEDWWGQGFSEPGSGSDLASLRTRARREGDEYVVDGSKIWTTDGQYADWLIVLVRTDPNVKPQRGISMILIETSREGVSQRPIESIDGGWTLNQFFFDGVRVPVANLVGEEGRGWDYAKFLLTNERTTSAEAPHTRRDLEQLKRIARTAVARGRPLIEDPVFRAKIAQLEIDLTALEWSVLRVLHMEERDPRLGSVASVLKMRGNDLTQRVADLCVDALGDMGVAMHLDPDQPQVRADDRLWPPLAPQEAAGASARSIFRRAASIYGGSNEIQRGIVAKAILGL